MNRAERPDAAGRLSTPVDVAAELDDLPIPSVDAGARGLTGDQPRTLDAPLNAPRLRLPIRVVGAPPDPEKVRASAEVALRALPVAGVSRRRMGWLGGAMISLWIVAVFARQVGEASAAGARADHVRADNAALSAEVAALQHERQVVQERSFVEFQARAYGLGNAQDQRFSLAQNAPPVPPDAPGSASMKLALTPVTQAPMDAWLALLFGPSR